MGLVFNAGTCRRRMGTHVIDLKAMVWKDHSSSFCTWFYQQVALTVEAGNFVTVRGRKRKLVWDDFGYTGSVIKKWDKRPLPEIPDGKKIRDIVGSHGFAHFPEGAKRQIVLAWIGRGLQSTTPPSDELISLLKSLAENSPEDFLVKAARQAFIFDADSS
jgi:hypothetical protein